MKYLGSITNAKDLVTKEYVDNCIGSGGSTLTATELLAMLLSGNNVTIEKSGNQVKISATDTVTKVKGNAESSYRSGNVNLTPANIGAATSDHTHDSRYYTETEINNLLAADVLKEKLGLNPVSVSLTRTTSNTPAASTVTCTYIPVLGKCFFRGYLAERSSKTFSSGTTYTLWTVPEGYRPSTRHALAITNGSNTRVDAWIKGDGTIEITPRGATISVSNLMYITGWWDV